MPIGNGEIGLNVWMENTGDLVFYVARTDSWDDNGRLLKVGRVRISISPRPTPPLKEFSQRLSLIDGTVHVRYGAGNRQVQMQIWVDANHPLVHVELESAQPVTATASIELWRTAPFLLPVLESSDPMLGAKNPDGTPVQVVAELDSLLRGQRGRIGWFHHNVKSVGPEILARFQGMKDFRRADPLLSRTFGGLITAPNGAQRDDTHLLSPSATRHVFRVCVLTKHPATPLEWLREVERRMDLADRIPAATAHTEHRKWWSAFWDRSWIEVTPAAGHSAAESTAAFAVSQGYALQRFINACAGRGEFPIKFNGSVFTVPHPGRAGDADYRQWGPGYWWQNTRLPYVSMSASGDFDLMRPLFKMYAEDLMPLFKYRTRLYMNHDGAFIPECINFWGDVFGQTYGWIPFEERTDKLQVSGYHKWEWVAGPELAWMMLEYYDHTQDETFLREQVFPTAREVLTFFDQHYQTDANGKLVMHPSQALETWWDCTNPMPEVAGLHAVLDRLLALPGDKALPAERAFWTGLRSKIPNLPTRVAGGTSMLAPAERFEDKKNIENPELYAVFPFRLLAFEKPDRELGIAAFLHRWDRGSFGWRQDDIFAAYLGLTDTAKAYLVNRARAKDEGSRFPAFWGPNYDWIPDQDHGSILLKTLQAMIIQSDGRRVYLFPSWPREWNVQFKLHAPFNTVVTGSFVNGKAGLLEVTPSARRAEVSLAPGR
jgi:hypothetical protein